MKRATGKGDSITNIGAIFPDFIASLPQADIPLAGLSARLLQCEGKQVLFMAFDDDVTVPEHSHEAQWGVALSGGMELSIDGVKRLVGKGDTYYIPKDAPHSVRIMKGYSDLTVFNQHDRYKPKA